MRPLVCVAIVAAGCSGTYSLDGGDLVSLGQVYAGNRKCADCHQAPDGTLSGTTAPLLRMDVPAGATVFGSNLTPDIATGIGGWADIQIVRALRAGVDEAEQPLCPPHPHLSDLGDVEANAIVAYLRSLKPVMRAIPPSMCPPLKPPEIDMSVADDLAPSDDLAQPSDGGVSD